MLASGVDEPVTRIWKHSPPIFWKIENDARKTKKFPAHRREPGERATPSLSIQLEAQSWLSVIFWSKIILLASFPNTKTIWQNYSLHEMQQILSSPHTEEQFGFSFHAHVPRTWNGALGKHELPDKWRRKEHAKNELLPVAECRRIKHKSLLISTQWYFQGFCDDHMTHLQKENLKA